jgi:hypothetical protein
MEVRTQTASNSRSQSAPVLDATGREVLAVVVKYTFDVSASGVVQRAEEPAEVDLVDTFQGEEPARSSIRHPSQLFHAKPGCPIDAWGRAGSKRAEDDPAVLLGRHHRLPARDGRCHHDRIEAGAEARGELAACDPERTPPPSSLPELTIP